MTVHTSWYRLLVLRIVESFTSVGAENLRMYVAEALRLREGDRGRLEAITRASTAPAGVARRARVVLLAADGVSNTEIANRVGVSRPTVLKWRDRYTQAGIDALADLPRP